VTFYFLPADIVSQTINFGLPAPYDIQVLGRHWQAIERSPPASRENLRHVSGAVDVRVQQPGDLQRLEFAIDRTKASELGLSERDVASSVLLSLSGSGQVQPAYWLDSSIWSPTISSTFRAPEYRMTSLSDLKLNAGERGNSRHWERAIAGKRRRRSLAPQSGHLLAL